MTRRRLDIPLDRDGSGRFLPWLIALMVFLAALATTGALALDHALEAWNNGLSGTLTVEIPASPQAAPAPAPASPSSSAPAPAAAPTDGALAAALAVLHATPGVLSATALDRAATMKLVAPWIGEAAALDDLPLPRLIDVRIDPDRGVGVAALATRLTAAAPGTILDDHRLWLDRLRRLVLSVEATALAIVAFIGGAAVLTVVFTTRASLAVHHDVIELLHLMGARDRYIAGQFQREALRLGLTGGLIGLALAALTLFGLAHAATASAAFGQQLALLPTVRLAPWHWAALAALPLAAAFIAMLTARLTVLGALARMP